MKCLSIRQPFASLILNGKKTVELRSWKTNYRGLLVIHAGSQLHEVATKYDRTLLSPRGKLIGIAELVDCRKATRTDEKQALFKVETDMYAWVIEKAKWIPAPISMKGRLGLFDLSDEVIGGLF